MEIFRISTTLLPLKIIGEVLILIGIVAFVAALIYYLARIRGTGKNRQFYRVFIFVVIFMVTGAPLYILGSSGGPGIVMIQHGSITVSGAYIGNNTYNTSDIKYAFVENLGSGNITLSSKNIGTNAGSINEGKFTLSNGASAHVISSNSTNLVILLNTGLYVILGSNQTPRMATVFSSSVFSVPGY